MTQRTLALLALAACGGTAASSLTPEDIAAAQRDPRFGPSTAQTEPRTAEEARARAEAARKADDEAAQRRQDAANDAKAERLREELKQQNAAAAQASAEAKKHMDDCATTYRARFVDLQKAAELLVTEKPKIAAHCKELAKHCSTSSLGTSYCHGITGQEHQFFDKFCSGGPVERVTTPESEACADVDSVHLAFDFSWSIEDARAFSKRKPPP